MTPEEKLTALIAQLEEIVPYVLATLPHPHVERSAVTTSDPEWTAVHRGRALSSRRQLEHLLKRATQ